MAVTVAEMQEGRKCAAYDMDYDDKYMNILDPQGFAVAVYQVLRIKPGGSLTLAPVCGTWVWLSRGSTKRSAQCPLGDPSASAAVAGANVMVARCVLLIILCASRGINWVLEQPQGSLLERHPAMQWLFTLLQVWRKSIKMGDFQAPTQKATWLYSGHRYIEEIDNYKPRQGTRAVASGPMVRHYRDSKGRPRVQGASGLKDSQSYTPAFGRAMAKLRTRNQARVRREAKAFLHSEAAALPGEPCHVLFSSSEDEDASTPAAPRSAEKSKTGRNSQSSCRTTSGQRSSSCPRHGKVPAQWIDSQEQGQGKGQAQVNTRSRNSSTLASRGAQESGVEVPTAISAFASLGS